MKKGDTSLITSIIQAEIDGIGDVKQRTTHEFRESGAMSNMVLRGWLLQLGRRKFFETK